MQYVVIFIDNGGQRQNHINVNKKNKTTFTVSIIKHFIGVLFFGLGRVETLTKCKLS